MIACGFSCQGCDRDFDWDSELPLVGAYEIKTIANRFCVDCIPLEARVHGISIEQVITMRKRRGRKVP